MYISSAEIYEDKIKLKYSDDSLDSCNDKVSLTSEQLPRPELYAVWGAMKKYVLGLVQPLQGFEDVSFYKIEFFNYGADDVPGQIKLYGVGTYEKGDRLELKTQRIVVVGGMQLIVANLIDELTLFARGRRAQMNLFEKTEMAVKAAEEQAS